MVYFVDGRIDLGFKVYSIGNIFWIGFRVFFMKCFRFLSICIILGSGDGIFVKLEVYEVVYGFFIFQGGVKGF